MIDIKFEKLITLVEATKFVPRRRRGRKPHVSTLYRWASPRGHRGVRLETIRVGGSLCTSIEALQRFFDRLTTVGSEPYEGRGTKPGQTRVEKELQQFGL
jgi:hypothetical protein